MKTYKTVDDFVQAQSQWKEAIIKLREIVQNTEMEETVKWGGPVYTVNGKNVVGLGAFKSYVGIWFFQGVLLNDDKKLLVSGTEGVTKALRQMRFNSIEEIDETVVKQYIEEAIENQKAGREIKSEKKKELSIPPKLAAALKEDSKLKEQFDAFTPYKQREYAEHIGGAKREETQDSRLEKAIPLILNGVGLHDKYR